MDITTVLHILRNPYSWSDAEQRTARLLAAEKLEQYKDAYENMRQFAEDNGLDTTTYGPK